MNYGSLALPVLALVLCPTSSGHNKSHKGRDRGPRRAAAPSALLRPGKAYEKGAVYSHTTSWVFRAGPVVGLVSAVAVLALLPLGGAGAPVGFSADLIVLAYLLGLMRFFTVIAALDTGSAFEGMGASP